MVEAISYYKTARQWMLDSGYSDEIEWQQSIDFESISEADFLRELAWVILNGGMREAVVRKKFPEITNAFYGLMSAQIIVDNAEYCIPNALKVFNHSGKINAIAVAARIIVEQGFDAVKSAIRNEGLAYLGRFAFIGPVLQYHLAKNLGLQVAKPDRHLVRLAEQWGFADVQIMCQTIGQATSDCVPVVDLVLWRYTAQGVQD